MAGKKKKKVKDPEKAKRREMEMKLLTKETSKQIHHVNEVSQEKIHAINNMLSCIRGENPPGGCESFVIAGGEEGKVKFAKVKAADAERAAKRKVVVEEKKMKELEEKQLDKLSEKSNKVKIGALNKEEKAINRDRLKMQKTNNKLQKDIDGNNAKMASYLQNKEEIDADLVETKKLAAARLAEIRRTIARNKARVHEMREDDARKARARKELNAKLDEETRVARQMKEDDERLKKRVFNQKEAEQNEKVKARLMNGLNQRDAVNMAEQSKSNRKIKVKNDAKEAFNSFMGAAEGAVEKDAEKSAVIAVAAAGNIGKAATNILAEKAYDRTFAVENSKITAQSEEAAASEAGAEGSALKCDDYRKTSARMESEMFAAQTESDKAKESAVASAAMCASAEEKATRITHEGDAKTAAESVAKKMCDKSKTAGAVADDAAAALTASTKVYKKAKGKSDKACGKAKSSLLKNKLKMTEKDSSKLAGKCEAARKKAEAFKKDFESKNAIMKSGIAKQPQMLAAEKAKLKMTAAESDAKYVCGEASTVASMVAGIAKDAKDAAKAEAALVPDGSAANESKRLQQLCDSAKERVSNAQKQGEPVELGYATGNQTEACKAASQATAAVRSQGVPSAEEQEIRLTAAMAKARAADAASASDAARLSSLCDSASAAVRGLETSVQSVAPQFKGEQMQRLIRAKEHATTTCGQAKKAKTQAKAIRAAFDKSKAASMASGKGAHSGGESGPQLAGEAGKMKEECTEAQQKLREMRQRKAPAEEINNVQQDMESKCSAANAAGEKFAALKNKERAAAFSAKAAAEQEACDAAKAGLAELKSQGAPADTVKAKAADAKAKCEAASVATMQVQESTDRAAEAQAASKAMVMQKACNAAKKKVEDLKSTGASAEAVKDAQEAAEPPCASAMVAQVKQKAAGLASGLATLETEAKKLQAMCNSARQKEITMEADGAAGAELVIAKKDAKSKCAVAARGSAKVAADKKSSNAALRQEAARLKQECASANANVKQLKWNSAPSATVKAAEAKAEPKCAAAAAAVAAAAQARQADMEDSAKNSVSYLTTLLAQKQGLCDSATRNVKALRAKRAPATDVSKVEDVKARECAAAADVKAKLDATKFKAELDVLIGKAREAEGACKAAKAAKAADAKQKCEAATELSAKAEALRVKVEIAQLVHQSKALKLQCGDAKKVVTQLEASKSTGEERKEAGIKAAHSCEAAAAAAAKLNNLIKMQASLHKLAAAAGKIKVRCQTSTKLVQDLKQRNADASQVTEAQSIANNLCEEAAAALAKLNAAHSKAQKEAMTQEAALVTEYARLKVACDESKTEVATLRSKGADLNKVTLVETSSKDKCDTAVAMKAKLEALRAEMAAMQSLTAESAIAEAACLEAQKSLTQLRNSSAPGVHISAAEKLEKDKCAENSAQQRLALLRSRANNKKLAAEAARLKEECDKATAKVTDLKKKKAAEKDVLKAIDVASAKCELSGVAAARAAAQTDTMTKELAAAAKKLGAECSNAKATHAGLVQSKAPEGKIKLAQDSADEACAAAAASASNVKAEKAKASVADRKAESAQLQAQCDRSKAALAALKQAKKPKTELDTGREKVRTSCEAAAAAGEELSAARDGQTAALSKEEGPLKNACEAAKKKASLLTGNTAMAARKNAKLVCDKAKIASFKTEAARQEKQLASANTESTKLRQSCRDAVLAVKAAKAKGVGQSLVAETVKDTEVKCTASLSATENLSGIHTARVSALEDISKLRQDTCKAAKASFQVAKGDPKNAMPADAYQREMCALSKKADAKAQAAKVERQFAEEVKRVVGLKLSCAKARSKRLQLQNDGNADKDDIAAADRDTKTKCSAALTADARLKADEDRRKAAALAAKVEALQKKCQSLTAQATVAKSSGDEASGQSAAEAACKDAEAAAAELKQLELEAQLASQIASSGSLRIACDDATSKLKELKTSKANKNDIHTAELDQQRKCAALASATNSSVVASELAAATNSKKAQQELLAVSQEAARLRMQCTNAKKTNADAEFKLQQVRQGAPQFDELAQAADVASETQNEKCMLADQAQARLRKADAALAEKTEAKGMKLEPKFAEEAAALQAKCAAAKKTLKALTEKKAHEGKLTKARVDEDTICADAAAAAKKLKGLQSQANLLLLKMAQLKAKCTKHTKRLAIYRGKWSDAPEGTPEYTKLSEDVADAEVKKDKVCAQAKSTAAQMAEQTVEGAGKKVKRVPFDLSRVPNVKTAKNKATKMCASAEVAKAAAVAAGTVVNAVVSAAADVVKKNLADQLQHDMTGADYPFPDRKNGKKYPLVNGPNSITGSAFAINAKRKEDAAHAAATSAAFKAAKMQSDLAAKFADGNQIRCLQAQKMVKVASNRVRVQVLRQKCELTKRDFVKVTGELAAARSKVDKLMLKPKVDTAKMETESVCDAFERALKADAELAAIADSLDKKRHATEDMKWCRDQVVTGESPCWMSKELCLHKRLGAVYRKQCPRTCGTCGKTLMSGHKECFDDEEYKVECPLRKDLCTDPSVGRMYRMQCPKTCGICQEMATMGPSEMEKLAEHANHMKKKVAKLNSKQFRKPSGSCVDKAEYKYCKSMETVCTLNPEKVAPALMGPITNAKAKCPATCNSCPKVRPGNRCEDDPVITEKACRKTRWMCTDPVIGKVFRKQCPKTCMTCVPSEFEQDHYLKQLDPCVNDPRYDKACDQQLELCGDTELGSTYRTQCPRSCGVCLKENSIDWQLQKRLKEEAREQHALRTAVIKWESREAEYRIGIKMATAKNVREGMVAGLMKAKKMAKEAHEKVAEADQIRQSSAKVAGLQKLVRKVNDQMYRVQFKIREGLNTTGGNLTLAAMEALSIKNQSLVSRLTMKRKELSFAENQKVLISMKGPCSDKPGKEKTCGLDLNLCTDPMVSDQMRLECPKTCGVCGKGVKYKKLKGHALPLTPLDAVVFRSQNDFHKAGIAAKRAMTDLQKAKNKEFHAQQKRADAVRDSIRTSAQLHALERALETKKTATAVREMQPKLMEARNAAVESDQMVNHTRFELTSARKMLEVAKRVVASTEASVIEAKETLRKGKAKQFKAAAVPPNFGPPSKPFATELRMRAAADAMEKKLAAKRAEHNLKEAIATKRTESDKLDKLETFLRLNKAKMVNLKSQLRQSDYSKDWRQKQAIQEMLKQVIHNVTKAKMKAIKLSSRLREQKSLVHGFNNAAKVTVKLAKEAAKQKVKMVQIFKKAEKVRSMQLDITDPGKQISIEEIAAASDTAEASRQNAMFQAAKVQIETLRVKKEQRELELMTAQLAGLEKDPKASVVQQAALRNRIELANVTLVQNMGKLDVKENLMSVDNKEAAAAVYEAKKIAREVDKKGAKDPLRMFSNRTRHNSTATNNNEPRVRSKEWLEGVLRRAKLNKEDESSEALDVRFAAKQQAEQAQGRLKDLKRSLSTAETVEVSDDKVGDAFDVKAAALQQVEMGQVRMKVLTGMQGSAETVEEKGLLLKKMKAVKADIKKHQQTVQKMDKKVVKDEAASDRDEKLTVDQAREKLSTLTLDLANLQIRHDLEDSVNIRTTVAEKIKVKEAEIQNLKREERAKRGFGGLDATTLKAENADQGCEASKKRITNLKATLKAALYGSQEWGRLDGEVAAAETESNTKCAQAQDASEDLAAASQRAWAKKRNQNKSLAAQIALGKAEAQEQAKEAKAMKEKKLSKSLDSALDMKNKEAKSGREKAAQLAKQIAKQQKKLKMDAREEQKMAQEVKATAATLAENKKILKAAKQTTNAKGEVKIEADAENAKSDAQHEMETAFKASAEANKEAKLIALRMVNITTLHDKALRDAKKAMNVMKKKIETTQAEAAVAKEAAAEAEARADQIENAAKAEKSESPTTSEEAKEEQKAGTAAVAGVEQLRIELEKKNKEIIAAKATAGKTKDAVQARRVKALQLQQEAQKQLEGARSMLSDTKMKADKAEQKNEQQRQQAVSVGKMVNTTSALDETEKATNKIVDANAAKGKEAPQIEIPKPQGLMSAKEKLKVSKAAERMKPNYMKKVLKMQNQTAAAEQKAAAIKEEVEADREAAAEEAEKSADAVSAGEKASRAERKAAETMIEQDDGKPMDAMKAAKIAGAKEAVRKQKAEARQAQQELEQSQKIAAAAGKIAATKTAAVSAGQDDEDLIDLTLDDSKELFR